MIPVEIILIYGIAAFIMIVMDGVNGAIERRRREREQAHINARIQDYLMETFSK